MRLRDVVRASAQSLRGNPVRSLLTVLGLSIGVGACIAIGSLGTAAVSEVNKEMDRFGVDRIWISESPDLVHWGNPHLLLAVEDFPFANDKIGPGAPPLRTDAGWLIFTHTVDIDPTRGKNGWEDRWIKRYCIAVALLDLNEPWKVLGYSKVPLLAPETDYETTIGFRTNVVFPTAALRMDDNIIRIYYGAADTVIAFAEAREEDLIQLCLKGE